MQARLHFISLKLKRAAAAAAVAAVNTIMKNDFLYYYYNYYYICEPNIILVYPHYRTVTHITYDVYALTDAFVIVYNIHI